MIKLGECLTIKHGWAFKGEFFAESGEQSILTPGNFFEAGGFKYNDERERYYTGEYPAEYLCKKGDLIVAMTEQAGGLLGSTAIVPKDNRYLHNQRIGLVTCDEKQITKMFAYYLFMTKSVREQISRTSSGTKVKHTSPEKIYDVEVSLPDIPTQKKIAHFLWTIDCKIRSNNQINDNLQQQLKLMYDYWFTQFDFPDDNGKPYRSSGGAMVWNEQLKRNIPAGWAADNLYAVADYINGLACQNYRPDNDEHKLPVIKITEMHNGITDSTEFVRDDIPEKYIIENGDILFSWSATLETMLWYGGRGGLNQHIFKVVPKASKYFAYSQLSSYIINFKAIAEARKTTMGHITTDHMEQSRIAIPPTIVQETFNRQVTPLYEEYANNCKENLRLQALRDWLLPMLMNGQATIAD